MKQFNIAVLKWYPYVEVALYNLPVPSGFGRRAGFDMSTSHILPQAVLAAITLVGGGAGDGGALGPDPGVRQGFPSAQGPSPVGGRSRPWSQIIGAKTLRVISKLALLLLNMSSLPCQHQHPWP